MQTVQWVEGPEDYESLAVSLRAILAGAGHARPYDELVSALGLGAALAATAGECPALWPTFARDAALPATARLLGLHVRELHPPAAAAHLDESAEFSVHFRDSYVPLIRRALEHQQLALVWRGWPPPAERAWGVVVATHDEQLIGYTVGTGGRMSRLTGAAHQVYVVEEYRPAEAARCTPAALFAHAVAVARALWHGQLETASEVATGAQAFARWRELAGRPGLCACGAADSYGCQDRMARVLAAARGCLGTWLRRVGPQLEPSQQPRAAAWAETCEHSVQHLGGLRDSSARPTHAELLRTIDELRDEEGRVLAELEGARAP